MRKLLFFVALSAFAQTDSSLVVVGDSHMSVYLNTPALPSLLSTANPYTVTNLAVAGSAFCQLFADHGAKEAQVDAFYHPQARSNVLVLEGGGNDMALGMSPEQVFNCQKDYALRRKLAGWKVVLYPLYSRLNPVTGYHGISMDTLHDQLNALYDANWPSFADAYFSHQIDNPNVWNDRDYDDSCFIGDQVHLATACKATLAGQLSALINQVDPGAGDSGFPLTVRGTNPAKTNILVTNPHASLNGVHDYDFGSDVNFSFLLYDDTLNLFDFWIPKSNDRFGINGGLQANTGTANKPNCDAGAKGLFWYSGHTTGSKDSVQVCAADARDVYAWRTIY